MPTVRAADCEQIMLYGREFDPAPEGNITYRLSGKENESRPTGNGGLHTKQTNKLGGFENLDISVDPSRQDIEFLQEKANGGEPGPCSFRFLGLTYSGDLTIQGAIDPTTGDGTVSLSAMGITFEQV